MSLRALARFCYRRRRLVVLCWIAALVGVNVLSVGDGHELQTNFSAPNTESTRASNLLAANFKAQSGDARAGRDAGLARRCATPRSSNRSRRSSPRSTQVPHVASVSDPYTTPGGISKSGTIALANAQLDAKSQDVPDSVGRQMIKLAEATLDAAARSAARRPAHPTVGAPVAVGRRHRHPRRDPHPADRVRVGARDGAADRRSRSRASRSGCRSSACSRTCTRCRASRRRWPR